MAHRIIHRAPAPRPRRGVVLVLVLVALVLVASLAAATQHASWRAARSARLAWNGERALQGAGEAVAEEIALWDGAGFAAMAIGAARTRSVGTSTGGAVQVTLLRTGPLVAVIDAAMTSREAGAPRAATRTVVRSIALDVPAPPTVAALVTLGDATVHDGAMLDGRDVASSRDGCGPVRDTASTAALRSNGGVVQGGATLFGAGAAMTYASDGIARARDGGALRALLDTVLPRIGAGMRHASGASLPAAAPWAPLLLHPGDTATSQVTVAGTSRHQGLVIVNGDLVVHGVLQLEGLLIVVGAVDTRTGTLDVLGGIVASDVRDGGSHIGGTTRVAWSPCAVRMALAAVARPTSRAFSLWSER